VDITTVTPSGANNTVTPNDIRNAARQKQLAEAEQNGVAPPEELPLPPPPPNPLLSEAVGMQIQYEGYEGTLIDDEGRPALQTPDGTVIDIPATFLADEAVNALGITVTGDAAQDRAEVLRMYGETEGEALQIIFGGITTDTDSVVDMAELGVSLLQRKGRKTIRVQNTPEFARMARGITDEQILLAEEQITQAIETTKTQTGISDDLKQKITAKLEGDLNILSLFIESRDSWQNGLVPRDIGVPSETRQATAASPVTAQRTNPAAVNAASVAAVVSQVPGASITGAALQQAANTAPPVPVEAAPATAQPPVEAAPAAEPAASTAVEEPAVEAKPATRDATKPEQMTKDELSAFRKSEAIKTAKDDLSKAKDGTDNPYAFGFKSKAALVRAREDALQKATSEDQDPDVFGTVIEAANQKRPIFAGLIDSLSDVDRTISPGPMGEPGGVVRSARKQLIDSIEEKGYVKEGDLYVFKGEKEVAAVKATDEPSVEAPVEATVETKPTEAEQKPNIQPVGDEELTAVEKKALALTKLKGTEQRTEDITFIPDSLMTASRRNSLRTERESRQMSDPRGGKFIEIKRYGDVIGDPTQGGWAIIDRRAVIAERRARTKPAEAPASPVEAATEPVAAPAAPKEETPSPAPKAEAPVEEPKAAVEPEVKAPPVQGKAVEKKTRRLARDQVIDVVPVNKDIPDYVDPAIKSKMYQMQIDGANAVINSMESIGAALNGDGTGVGKTRQIIAVAKYYADKGDTVFIISKNDALGKPYESDPPKLTGSMDNDSADMGVSLNLFVDQKPEKGKIYVGAYHRIEAENIPAGSVVIFDEANELANTFGEHPNDPVRKEWATKFRKIIESARKISYYTATPGDKVHQFAYLHKVLGFATPNDFLGEMINRGARVVSDRRRPGEYKVVYSKADSKNKLFPWINELMVGAGNNGGFIKREISYEGVSVQFMDVKGTSDENPWSSYYKDALAKMDAFIMAGWKILAPDSAALYAAELTKIGSTVDLLKNELSNNRSVVVFTSRIKPMDVRISKKIQGMYEEETIQMVGFQLESPVELLKNELKKNNIEFSELHSKSKKKASQVQKDFQSGKTKVIIASLESGGTGINLDDTVGNNPRTIIYTFAPYRGVSAVQGNGRIWRSSTIQNDNSPNRIVTITATDISLDTSRASVLSKKLQLMGAAIGGDAVSRIPMSDEDFSTEMLTGLELPEDEGASQFETGKKKEAKVFGPIEVKWKETKPGAKFKFSAPAPQELSDWFKSVGRNNPLGVVVFQTDSGSMLAVSNETHPPEAFATNGPASLSRKPGTTEDGSPNPNVTDDLSVSAYTGRPYTPAEARKAGVTRIASDLGLVNGNQESVFGALEKISKSGNRRHRKVAKDLLKVLQGTDVTVQMISVDPSKNGWFDPATGTVYLNLDGPHETGIVETLLHELVHAGTERAISNPATPAQKALVDSLQKQMDSARKAAADLIKSKLGKDVDLTNWRGLVNAARMLNDYDFFDVVYGLSSLSEFATHATTSKAFQKFLSGVGKDGKPLGLFDRFVRSIAKYFTGQTDIATDVYNDIISLIGSADKGSVRMPNIDREKFGELVGKPASESRGVTPQMDAEYLSAVERGDMDEAQRLVDQAAMAAKFQRELWHGTTVTKYIEGKSIEGDASAREKLKDLADKYGISDWSSVASIFERWVEYGMATENGITVEDAGEARRLYESSKGTSERGKEAIGFDVFSMPSEGIELGVHLGTEQQAESFGETFRFWVNISNPLRLPDLGTWNYQSVMREARKRGAKISEEEYEVVFNARDENQALRDLLIQKGYDGIVYRNEAEGYGDSFIAFKPSQIKSADPVTRDDQGNVIPLSQRFNPESPDIRFSESRGIIDQQLALYAPDLKVFVEPGVKDPIAYNGIGLVINEEAVSEMDGDDVRLQTQRAALASRFAADNPLAADVIQKPDLLFPALMGDSVRTGVARSLMDASRFAADNGMQPLAMDLGTKADAFGATGIMLSEARGIGFSDSDYISAMKSGNTELAQLMIDDGSVKMNRKIFEELNVRPEATQIGTTIHSRLKSAGVISNDDFKNGLVYGDGKGAASADLGADSYEPFPPSDFKPTYSGDRSAGVGDAIEKKYDTILNTFVLNVVDPQTRDFIVKDIANLLNKGGRAVIVTRGTDVLNSKPVQDFRGMSRLQRKGKTLTYQKGFTQQELISYLSEVLGDGFDVSPVRGGSSSDVRVQFIKTTNENLPNPLPIQVVSPASEARGVTPDGVRRFDLVDAVRAAKAGEASTPFVALNEAINANTELTRRIKAESERRKAPYARGKGAILQQIITAGNSGRLPKEAIKPITDFVNSVSEKALEDTRISLSVKPKSSTFDFTESLVTLALNGLGSSPNEIDRTAVHEFWHGLSRFIPDEEIEKMRVDYVKAVKKYIAKNPWFVPFIGRTHLNEDQYDDLSRMLSKEEMDSIPWKEWETLDNGKRVRGIKWDKENYRLFRLDEWVVENGADLVRRKQERPTTFLGKIARLIRDFIDTLKQALGDPYLRALDAMTMPDEAFNAVIQRDGPIEEYPPVMYGGVAEGMNNQFVLGMYAGEKSLENMPEERRVFMQDSLDAAKAMAAAGKTSEEIRAVTGWFPGKYDGKMRWEVPDNEAELRLSEYRQKRKDGSSQEDIVREFFQAKQQSAMELALKKAYNLKGKDLIDFSRRFDSEKKKENLGVYSFYLNEENRSRGRIPLSYILKHDQLFDLYPELRFMPVSFNADDMEASPFAIGAFDRSFNGISLNPIYAFKNEQDSLSTVLHEIQHAIQQIEGFARGSSETGMKAVFAEANRIPNTPEARALWGDERVDAANKIKSAVNQYDKTSAFKMYQRAAGEIESRDVQARQALTPEQRAAVAPYSSENIAPEDAIVLYSTARGYTPAPGTYVAVPSSGWMAVTGWIASKFRSRGNLTQAGLEVAIMNEQEKKAAANAARFLGNNLGKQIEKVFGRTEKDTKNFRVFTTDSSGKPSFTRPYASRAEADAFAAKMGYTDFMVATPEELMNIALGNSMPSLTPKQEEELEAIRERGIAAVQAKTDKLTEQYLRDNAALIEKIRKSGGTAAELDKLKDNREIFQKEMLKYNDSLKALFEEKYKEVNRKFLLENKEKFLSLQANAKMFLPDSILNEIEEARAAIDGRSKEIAGIDYLMKDGMMRIVFSAQEGIYVTRAYEAFESKNREDYVNFLNEAYRSTVGGEMVGGKPLKYREIARERITPLVNVLTGKIIEKRAKDIIAEQNADMVSDLRDEMRIMDEKSMYKKDRKDKEMDMYLYLSDEYILVRAKNEVKRRRAQYRMEFIRGIANYLVSNPALLGLPTGAKKKEIRAAAMKMGRDAYNDPDSFDKLITDSAIDRIKLLKYKLISMGDALNLARWQYKTSENLRVTGKPDTSGIKWRTSIGNNQKQSFIEALNSDFQKNLDFILGAPVSGSGGKGVADSWQKLNDEILMHRDNIPAYMRKFWGETESPVQRVTETITKQASLIADAVFRENIAKLGLEEGWAVKKEDYDSNPNKYLGYKRIIEGDEGYEDNPLADIYIDGNIYNSLEIRRSGNQPSNNAFKAIGYMVGAALWNATSGLMRGAVRNLASFPSWGMNSGQNLANPITMARVISNFGIASGAIAEHLATVPRVKGGTEGDPVFWKWNKNLLSGLLQLYSFTGPGSKVFGGVSGVIGTISDVTGRAEKESDRKAFQDLYTRAVNVGVADNNIERNDMARLLGYEDELTRRPITGGKLARFLPSWMRPDDMQGAMDYLVQTAKSTAGNRTEYYSSMDSVTKITFWLSEMEEQAKIHAKDKAQFNEWRGENGMFQNLPKELQIKAANNINDTIQSDSRVLEGVNQFRKNGWGKILSPFLASKTEFIRTAMNSYRIALDEMKNGVNQKEKIRGARRLVSALTGHIGYPIVAKFLAVAVMRMVGGGDDEEKEGVTLDSSQIDSLRKLLPEWAQNKVLAGRAYANGEIDWADVSFQLPFGWSNEIVISAKKAIDKASADDILAVEVTMQIVSDFIGNFASRQIAVEAASNALSGFDRVRNKTIWEKDDSVYVKIAKGIKYYMNAAGYPGDVRDAIKMYKAAYGIEENGSKYKMDAVLLSMLTGQSIRTQKIDEMYLAQMRQAQDDLRIVNRSLYQSALRDANDVEPEDVIADTKLAMTRHAEIMRELGQMFSSATSLLEAGGMTPRDAKKKILAIMRSEEVKLDQRDERAIANQYIPPWRGSDVTERKIRRFDRKYDDGRLEAYLDAIRR
jgi:hypothetical protein